MAELQETPLANRLHIGIFGCRNSGKSSLINALTGQQAAVVSSHPGTTTDPVVKAMEIHGLGPVALIDTAGYDDEGDLGALRLDRTSRIAAQTDMALLVVTDESDRNDARQWKARFDEAGVPTLLVLNKIDLITPSSGDIDRWVRDLELRPCPVSALTGQGMDKLVDAMVAARPSDFEEPSITGDLCQKSDVVVLVAPQDLQAPKGRLILPQVQTLRELLDKECLTLVTPTGDLTSLLDRLKNPPDLVITDSQLFAEVAASCPTGTKLTSFSVLMAGYKGDLTVLCQGARAIGQLTSEARVLIAEACTHAPLEEDIGRVKIPRLLRQRVGEGLTVDVIRGPDFPDDLESYDLVIHCGACTFNRRFMMARLRQCRHRGVPITNYGLAIAFLSGILDRVALPGSTAHE